MPSDAGPGAPEVVLDLEHRDGVFVLVLANTGPVTAYRPRVAFDGPLPGLAGRADIAALPVWQGLALLRPGAQVDVLLDHAASAEGSIAATVTYADRSGRDFEERFEHDLGTYDGLPTPL